MSGTLSKRQQARNERALQDLIKTIPGNSVCADCSARNPGWASWSLGIFLCMRCAAIHRKLGTHITKVKSLSMDSWSNDQVENMKRVGNTISNRMYNPTNKRPPVPIDADEADSAMERFIRSKYADRAAARHDTGSTNSDDHPPPLPPKTGSKFGFRSASSIFPLSSSKTRRERPPPVDIIPTRRRSPSPDFAPAKARSVDTGGPLDLAGKMNRLKDMGFADPKRNLAVLNGLGGNLEKTIDTLVRLGEGNGNRAGSSRGSRTPVTPAFPNSPLKGSNKKPSPPAPITSNPFDLLDVPAPAQPQSSQSTGSMQNLQPPANTNPFLSPTANANPFGLSPSQSQYNLNAAFQNLDVSGQQSTQPLFPNHTGGYTLSPPQSAPMYQQSPPLPTVPQQYYAANGYTNQPQVTQNTSYNPFLQQPVQPIQHQQTQSANTILQSNPYTQQKLFSSPLQTPQYETSSSVFDQAAPQQVQPQQQSYNPFLSPISPNNQSQVPQQPLYGYQNQQPSFPQHAQTYPILTQQPIKANNQSIMDLFNHPQLAPAKPQVENQVQQQYQQQQQPQMPVQASSYAVTPPQPQQPQFPVQAQTNFQPAGSKNPFNNFQMPTQTAPDLLGSMPTFQPAPQQNGSRHISQESMSISAGGWGNGRHSPDAWGTISGRGMR